MQEVRDVGRVDSPVDHGVGARAYGHTNVTSTQTFGLQLPARRRLEIVSVHQHAVGDDRGVRIGRALTIEYRDLPHPRHATGAPDAPEGRAADSTTGRALGTSSTSPMRPSPAIPWPGAR